MPARARLLMLIRHAEEPGPDAAGVDERGRPDADSLSVRGWQRAGALAACFGSGRELQLPAAIFAARDAGKSERPLRTVEPLARRLGLAIDTRHGSEGRLEPLLAAVESCEGPVLLCWRHQGLPAIVAALVGASQAPARWDPARYDLVWLLARGDDGWRFREIGQRLLDGDR